jgi:hypothetical protein
MKPILVERKKQEGKKEWESLTTCKENQTLRARDIIFYRIFFAASHLII